MFLQTRTSGGPYPVRTTALGMSSSVNAPRIETAQLDEAQAKRLDLRQHAVERGPIQNTCQHGVFTLQLRHRRLKHRQGGRAKVAGDSNRVQTRTLLWSASPRSISRVPIVSVGGDEPPPQGGGL